MTKSVNALLVSSIVMVGCAGAGEMGAMPTPEPGINPSMAADGNSMGAMAMAPQPLTLTRLRVSAPGDALAIHDLAQLTATAIWSDGHTADVTAQTAFAISDESVARLGAGAMLDATGGGTAKLTASYATLTSTTNITVLGPALVGVIANVDALLMSPSDTRDLSLSAQFADGSSESIPTSAAAWSSDDEYVIAMMPSDSATTVAAVGEGHTVISAAYASFTANIPVDVLATGSIPKPNQ